MPDSTSSAIQKYYDSFESRLGFRLFFGGAMHLGYYASQNSWPLPLSSALRAMEAKLLESLQCKKGSKVLDAGCGVGRVALYVAQEGGLRVEGIDVTPHHILQARRSIEAAGMGKLVSVRQGNYHHLENFHDAEFDGVYTMESLVHSTQPREVLREFLRLLKPGGCLVMHEYDQVKDEQAPTESKIAKEAKLLHKSTGVPETGETERLEEIARGVGFGHVQTTDMSKHIVPFLWLFYVCAYIPYYFLKLFGLQYYFVNLSYAIGNYKSRDQWRYVQIKAIKSL